MRTLLLDDEPHSLALLAGMIEQYCPSLQIVGRYNAPEEAVKAVHQQRPELVFLDVEMPGMTGFEFLQQFKPVPFRVIFTTGHSAYAVRAFEFSALHYLLKPVGRAELLEAVHRALEISEHNRTRQLEILFQLDSRRIVLPMPRSRMHIQPISEIVYCMAVENCCEVYRPGQEKLYVTKLLKDLEVALNEDLFFFRVHKKYLVNLRHVTDFQDKEGLQVLLSTGQSLPVARDRKRDLLEVLSRL